MEKTQEESQNQLSNFQAEAEEAGEDVLVSGELWLGLSANIQLFIIDLQSREYRVGVTPGIGYGLKWRPSFWTISKALLALDFFFKC